ncbi:MAG: hypothetical protein C4576_01995 [Desulfobacteraceae bacterium]|nr:MAG: hypothetical protein C4576_01995 [Desulfobacteraceae bacterium]
MPLPTEIHEKCSEPSETDLEVTAQLKSAGSVVGIELLDHIIFNRSDYYSFLEAGRL